MERHYIATSAIKEGHRNIQTILKKETRRYYSQVYNNYISFGSKEDGILLGMAAAVDILCELIWPHCEECNKKLNLNEYCCEIDEDDEDFENKYHCLSCYVNLVEDKRHKHSERTKFSILQMKNDKPYPHLYTDKNIVDAALVILDDVQSEVRKQKMEKLLQAKILDLAQKGDLKGIREI